MRNRVSSVFLLIILVAGGIVSTNGWGQSNSDEPKAIEAVEGLVKAFDRYPLVALGEVHWSKTENEFVHSLIRRPSFADKVNDIVVEFGNGLYQPIMDRYIAGETVARTELRQVWRNTAAGSMAGSGGNRIWRGKRCLLLITEKNESLLNMPRIGGNFDVRHAQKPFGRDLLDFQAIEFPRF